MRTSLSSTSPLSLALGAALVLSASACSGNDKDSGADDAGTGVVLAGFNHTWKSLSHRVSLAEVALNEDGTVTSGMVGGDWSTGSDNPERATFAVHQSHITAEGFVVGHGSVDVVTGPDGLINETVTIEVPGLGDAARVSGALRGFSILTDIEQSADYGEYDPALGYCVKGFGFSVSEPTLDGDSATVTLGGSVRWGPAGEDDPLYEQRIPMNEAIPFAQTAVSVHFTVIGYDGTLTTGSGTGSVDYPNGVYSDQPPLSESDLGINVSTDGTGFPVLRSFDLALDVVGDAEQGEYVRSYAVELSDADPLALSTEMTNSSLVETATIAFTPTVDVGWISLAGDASVHSMTATGEHLVGTVTVAGDETYAE
mgnify:CR=1 FL=1